MEDMFIDSGYALKKGVFSQEEAMAAADWVRAQPLKELAKSWTDQEPGVDLAVWQNIHPMESNPISNIANNSEMLNIASELMNDEVYIWSSKINLKAAWAGTVEYYHQDFVYWKDRGYREPKMLACMVFLDEHNIFNGGLHVLKGSHKLGYVEHESFINTNGLSKYMIAPEKLDEYSKEYEVCVIDAEPGDVLYFHTSLIHGSAHNISARPRMILLSQLNTRNNKPDDVHINARDFNLKRCERELEEAKRRLAYFEEKYQKQLASDDVTFNSPIPKEELAK